MKRKDRQAATRRVLHVHLLPQLVAAGDLRGGVAVVIDVLRASTTVVHALAAGCTAVFPVAEVSEARGLAATMRGRKVLRGGERGGKPISGFDLGNSPAEYTAAVCKGAALILTTTNGTRALLHAAAADRVMVAGFCNFSAVCEQLAHETRPLHLVCAGTDDEITLEDTLLAGAFVEALSDDGPLLNDGARLAWDCFEIHGMMLLEALKLSKGGVNLLGLGYGPDIEAAVDIDRFMLVPELRRDPLRLEIGRAGVVRSRWPRR